MFTTALDILLAFLFIGLGTTLIFFYRKLGSAGEKVDELMVALDASMQKKQELIDKNNELEVMLTLSMQKKEELLQQNNKLEEVVRQCSEKLGVQLYELLGAK